MIQLCYFCFNNEISCNFSIWYFFRICFPLRAELKESRAFWKFLWVEKISNLINLLCRHLILIKKHDCNFCINVTPCAIWYHLYNLKNVKNTHKGVLFLVKLQAKSNTPPLVFFTFWYCTNGHKSHKTSQNLLRTFFMSNFTGLIPPPYPHILSKRTIPCLVCKKLLAVSRASLKTRKSILL